MSCFSELKMICENQAEAERAMPLGDSETAGGAFWLVPATRTARSANNESMTR